MINNIKKNKSKGLFDSVLVKRIFLKYNKENEMLKEKESQFIQSLIQNYIKKDIGARIKLNRTWICIKIKYNNQNENKINYDEETEDSINNLINLFTVPKDISSEIFNYLKEYDKYVEIIDEPKEEYLIDLTSYIINNKEQYFKAYDDINLFLHKMKIQIEQNFNINISIGKGNNALLASLACLKCFIEKSNKKSNQTINFNGTNYLFENENKYDFLISVENNENSIISFLNTFPLEYLANSENKYIENFNRLINIKDFIDTLVIII